MASLVEPEACCAAYRSSRRLIVALTGLYALSVAGAAAVVTADGGWRGTWMTGAAGAYAVGALLVCWLVLRVSGRSLVVYPTWFDYRTTTEVLRARWDQVDTVYATPAGLLGRRNPFGRYEYRFEVCGRRVDAGTSVGADAALGRIVLDHTLPHLRDRSLAHLRSGRPVCFGPVTLEPGFLVVRALTARRIDLDRITAQRPNRGRLLLELKGRPRRLHIPLRRVPNAAVLLDLLHRLPEWGSAQRPKKARTKNHMLAGRSAIRRVR